MRYVIALMLAVAIPSAAQALQCGDLKAMTRTLEEKHGEVLQWYGLDMRGRINSLYASPDKQTRTILLTPPGMPTCIVSHGKGFELVLTPSGDQL